MVLYGWFAYKTMSSNYDSVHGPRVVSRDSYLPSCQSKYWTSMPEGWHVAPDTGEVRRNVVAPYTWSTHLMVLHNESGHSSSYPAYRTAALSPAGERFGDDRPKLQRKTLHTGQVQYRCPWQCYQILIRTPIRGLEENDSIGPQNNVAWLFSDPSA